MPNITKSTSLGSSQVWIKNLANSQYLSDTEIFKINSLTISESALTIPTFTIQYQTTDMFNFLTGVEELSISVNHSTSEGKNVSLAYDKAVVTSAGPNMLSGVLISKDQYFTRKSTELKSNLKDSIKQLGIRKSVDEINTSSDTSFYQLNETDWECTERLLNISDSDKLWAVVSGNIKVFSVTPKNPTKDYLGKITNYVFDSRKTGQNLTTNQGSSDANNFYYGRRNICVPSLSKYPRSCISSLLAKTKYKDGWANITVVKTYPLDPNYEIGSSVSFEDWESHGTFLVIGRSLNLGLTADTVTYTFANYADWNVASSSSSGGGMTSGAKHSMF